MTPEFHRMPEHGITTIAGKNFFDIPETDEQIHAGWVVNVKNRQYVVKFRLQLRHVRLTTNPKGKVRFADIGERAIFEDLMNRYDHEEEVYTWLSNHNLQNYCPETLTLITDTLQRVLQTIPGNGSL